MAAPAARVYEALSDPEELLAWLPPTGMSGRFDRFDLRPGGGYLLVLTYADPAGAPGKATANSDIVDARFVDVVPGVRLVQAVDFVSDDPAFAGTMTMTWEVTPVAGGSRVDIRAADVPAGISAEDHAEGLASSLRNLAAHLERWREGSTTSGRQDTTRASRAAGRQAGGMLIDGFNHVAVLTSDTDRLVSFYREMFGATVDGRAAEEEGFRLTIVKVGATAELNVFEITGNDEASRQTPMFGRGRLDHLALQAASLPDFETIRDRLIAAGATDGFVTDFGPIFSLFFTDPDGLEAEVCVANPDGVPGEYHPPGTPAQRYQSR